MLKIGTVALIGLAVLGWLAVGPGQIFTNDPPPIIRAEPGPIKHRPEGYVAQHSQRPATRISTRQDRPDEPSIDVNFRLTR